MTDLILKYLVTRGEVKIPGFGIFQHRDSPAFYDEKSAAFLPPGKEFFFDVDFDLKDESIVHYLSVQKNISVSESNSKIKELTSYWKSSLENKKEFTLPELGSFFINDNSLVFKGKRFTTKNPDNFGLEEVNLAQLKNKHNNLITNSNTDYRTSNNKLWWLFFIIPTAAIIYFASQNPDLIFGKKSFQNSNKIKMNPIKKKQSLKTDSISLKNTANAQK
ncbi:hypothetical protein [Halpernia sp. GG3]